MGNYLWGHLATSFFGSCKQTTAGYNLGAKRQLNSASDRVLVTQLIDKRYLLLLMARPLSAKPNRAREMGSGTCKVMAS